MTEVKQKKIALKQLGDKCSSIKKVAKARAVFSQEVGAKSVEEALSQYPTFMTEEALKPYLNKPDSTNAAFLHHCQKALKSNLGNGASLDSTEVCLAIK